MTKKFNSPLSGALSFIRAQTEMIMTDGNYQIGDIFNTVLDNYTIDTCCPRDTYKWETGIEPKGKKWIIVEQYKDKDDAKIGHEKWVHELIENPNLSLEDIDLWNFGK